MATQKFQGYAQRRGFQQRDPGWSALDKMKEQSNTVIRGLENNLRAFEKRSAEAEDALRQSQRNQEKNRKDIFIEDDIHAIQKEALNRNIATTRRNKDAEVKRIEAEGERLQSYAKFSQTLATALIQRREQKISDTVDAAYLYNMSNGASPLDRQQQKLAENFLVANGQKIEATANLAAAKGAFPKSVAHIRSLNQAWEYGNLKAVAAKAGESFGIDAEAYLASQQVTGTIDTKVALDKFQIQYLKEKGLYGLPSDFLIEMFDDVRKSRQVLVYNAQKLEVSEQSKTVIRQAENSFFSVNIVEKQAKLNGLFKLKSDVFENGQTANGGTAAAEYIIKDILGDPAKVTDEELKELLKVKTDNGQTWGERYRARIYKMRRERSNQVVQDYRLQLSLDTVASNKKVDDVIAWIKGGNWNKDLKAITELKVELKKQGVTKEALDRLSVYEAQSFQHQREDYWTQELSEKRDAGTLSNADYIPGLVPPTVWEKFSDDANAQDKARGTIGYSDSELKQHFGEALVKVLKKATYEDASGALSFRSAEVQAIKDYNQHRLALQKHGVTDLRKAAEDAKAKVYDDIINGRGHYSISEGSELRKEDGSRAYDNDHVYYSETFFPAFVPGTHKGAQKYNNPSDEAYNIQLKQRENPRYILDTQFVETTTLIKEADALNKGLGLVIPRVIYHMVEDNPSLGSPLEIMKNQFKLAGIDINIGDDFRLQWASATTGNDPNAVKLIQNIRGIEDAAIAHEIVFNNGSSNIKYMHPTIQRALVPKTIRQSVLPETVHPALKSLIDFTDGKLENNFVFKLDKNNKPTLEILDLETMHYLIDKSDETGWIYNLDTGLLDYVGVDK